LTHTHTQTHTDGSKTEPILTRENYVILFLVVNGILKLQYGNAVLKYPVITFRKNNLQIK